MRKTPKVTVVILSYNHEKYIAKAIESVLMQRVSFYLQILIADDGSTDKSLQIINDFVNNNPEKVIVLESSSNRGVRQNVLQAIKEIDSEYVAILDGDDYWSYELKLQHQIDLLEANKEYNGVFHDAQIEHIDDAQQLLFADKQLYSQNYVYPTIVYPHDVLARNIIFPSSSAVLRYNLLDKNDWALITDNYSILWKLTCIICKHSKFYFINEAWSVYRNHQKGISKSNNVQFHLSHINFLNKLRGDNYYKYYQYEISQSISDEYFILLSSQNDMPSFEKRGIFRKYLWSELSRLWYLWKKMKQQAFTHF